MTGGYSVVLRCSSSLSPSLGPIPIPRVLMSSCIETPLM